MTAKYLVCCCGSTKLNPATIVAHLHLYCRYSGIDRRLIGGSSVHFLCPFCPVIFVYVTRRREVS